MEQQDKKTIINSIRAVSFNITDFIGKLYSERIFPAWKENTNKVVNAINNKESTNPKEITNPINSKLDEVKKSIEDKEFPEYPEQIDARENIDKGTEAIESLGDKLDKLDPKVTINTDLEPIIKLLTENKDKAQLLKKLDEIKAKFKEPNNYTGLLEEISGKIEPVDNSKIEELLFKISDNDFSEIVAEYLRVLLEKPLPNLEKFTSKDGKRIKVEVDRSGGGGTTGTYNASDERINPATEEKQDAGNSLLIDIKDNQTSGDQIAKAYLFDGYGKPINSLNGAINVHDSHVHNVFINHFAYYKNGVTTTLNGALTAGDRVITLTSATGFSVGNYLDIKDGTNHIHHWRKIIAISGNDVTIDAGVDQDFDTGSVVDFGIANMNVDGSSTPVSFVVTPKSGEILHMNRCLPAIISDSSANDNLFGGITALTNGVVLRININNGESYETLTTWRSNKDMKEDMFNVEYDDSSVAGPGVYSVHSRWTFTASGTAIKVDSNNNEVLEVLIQDDLTDLVDFQIKFQGHPEE